MSPRPLGTIGPMVQGPWGPWGPYAAMQLLGPGRSRTHATALAAYGPYGPQGPWAQPLFEPVAEPFRFCQDFGRPKNKKCEIS